VLTGPVHWWQHGSSSAAINTAVAAGKAFQQRKYDTAYLSRLSHAYTLVLCGVSALQAAGYGKVVSHVVIGLKTVKGTKQLKLDPTIYDSLQKERVQVRQPPDAMLRPVDQI
jgi:hypothetical protein